MNAMKRICLSSRWLLVVAACSCLACAVEAEAIGEPPECRASSPALPVDVEHPRAAEYQAALEEAVDAGLPGVVMAVRDAHGTWEGAAGWADLGRGTPMEVCHQTRIASVTKTFVAVTVLLLAEDGLVDLDAPLTDYLPEQRGRLAHADAITLRHLLRHTSGVYNFLDVSLVLELFNRPERTWTLDACYAHALDAAPAFAPGEDWAYSNTNYLLAARVIEAVTDQPHAEVMRERIFEPLALHGTDYAPDAFAFPGITRGYFDLMGDGALVDSTLTYANTCVGPDGGMAATAHDMLVFYDALLSAQTLLEPESLDALWPAVETGEADFPRYGLGVESWEDGGYVGVGHGGHEFGYRSFAYHFPEPDVTFVLWTNASSLVPTEDNIAVTINAQRARLRDLVLDATGP